ncbi:hypothetical protein [Virgibacillus sp. YIM 98842]|uniref:hypothetical protein n=1 Tax=Virgibacillus sp. YIM 98842 TaxID=2663533 RepID=UPI0013DA34E2|nr:hypothetical protein [Virgibacillus sp. YIM 98842]
MDGLSFIRNWAAGDEGLFVKNLFTKGRGSYFMEIIFMFIAGFIVFIIAVIAIVKGVTHRVKRPTDDLKAEVSHLKKRVSELENEKKI